MKAALTVNAGDTIHIGPDIQVKFVKSAKGDIETLITYPKGVTPIREVNYAVPTDARGFIDALNLQQLSLI